MARPRSKRVHARALLRAGGAGVTVEGRNPGELVGEAKARAERILAWDKRQTLYAPGEHATDLARDVLDLAALVEQQQSRIEELERGRE